MARNLSILRKRAGFTLVELLVVVAIVVLLTAIVTPAWQASQASLALRRSAVKLSQDIKRAEELAIQAKWFSCSQGRISSYGMYFSAASPTSYVLFADCNGNRTYEAGADGVIDALSPESGVAILSVSQDPLSIAFVPPDPAVYFNGVVSANASAMITIALQNNPSVVKSIIINSKGVVSVQ